MRPLPFQEFRRCLLGVRKPERGAVVVGDRKPEAFRQEGQAADGRRRLEFARLLGLHERGLAGRPGDGALGPKRDMIDPAMLRVSGDDLGFTLGIGRDHLAVVAAGDDALFVGGRRQDRTVVNRDAPRFAFRLDEQHRFLAEHEHGRVAQKMRGDDRRAGSYRMRAVGDGNGISAGVGHSLASLPGLTRQSTVR